MRTMNSKCLIDNKRQLDSDEMVAELKSSEVPDTEQLICRCFHKTAVDEYAFHHRQF